MKYNNQKILVRNESAEIILAAYNTGKSEQAVLIKTVLPKDIDSIYDRLCHSRELFHPGIQPIIEFGKCGKSSNFKHYVTCEHTPGITLTQLLQRLSSCKKNLPQPLILHIISSISETIEYLHNQPVADFVPHGNICPDNILITFSGEILMIDTGIADLVTFRYDGVSMIPNTHTIFSHEDIAQGKEWKKRHEIHSLGLLLLCMLIGYNHFMVFYNQGETHKIESPSQFFPSIPAELNRIIVKAIGNKPFGRYARYSSIQEFISDLHSYSSLCNISFSRDITATTIFALFFDSEQIPHQLHFLHYERMIDYIKKGSDNAIKLLLNSGLESMQSLNVIKEQNFETTVSEHQIIKEPVIKPEAVIDKQMKIESVIPPQLTIPDVDQHLPLPQNDAESDETIMVEENQLQQRTNPDLKPFSQRSIHAFSSIIIDKSPELLKALTVQSDGIFSEQNSVKAVTPCSLKTIHEQASFSAIRLRKNLNENTNEHPFSKLFLKGESA